MTDDLLRGDDQGYNETEAAANHEPRVGQATGTQASGAGGSEVVLGQAGEAVVINRPAPGQTVEIQAAAGQTYVLNFAPGDAQVQVQGGNFILAFDDNGDGTPDSQVVFLDLVSVADGADAPSFQIAGVDIGAEVLLGQALALAGEGEVPLPDVAAGPGGLSGGASAYSDNLGSILDLLVAQGVIPPTVLEFRLIELEDRITFIDEAEGEIDLTFRTDLDGGEGGSVHTWEGGFEDWQPVQDGCDPAEFPMQVIVGFTPSDNEELVSFTISGIPDGAKFFVGGTEVTIVDGTTPPLTPADLASGLHLLPPEDSGDDIPLTVTATIVDPDSGNSSVISGSAIAIIDSVADNPFAQFDGEIADGGEGCCDVEDRPGSTREEIEAFLGLSDGDLNSAASDDSDATGPETATVGTAIKTTLELEAGDRIEITFNFLDAENSGPNSGYNDFAFISVNGTVSQLSSVSTANNPTGATYLGGGLMLSWSQESGYFTVSGTVETAGSYVIGIGVMNEDDDAVDSALLVDSLVVTRGDEVVIQDEFTSFDNWEILGGGFAAIVADVHTNEGMPGAPTQALLIASGPIDPSSCGCEVIVSKVTYNEDNAEKEVCELPTQSFAQGGNYDDGYGGDCDDCGADQQPIFGAGFVAGVNDKDGSESLTKITITTTNECWPCDPKGLEMPLSGVDDPTATNFMIGEQVLVHGETVEVWALFADGSTGLAEATIDISDGVLTLTFDPSLRVQSVDLSSGSDTPFQVRLPQHSDDDFQLNLEVTAQEYVIDGELDLNNNTATHQAVLNVEVKAVADGAKVTGSFGEEGFAEDGEDDPANHGEDSGETGLAIPLTALNAELIDKDGSEGITEIKIHLEGADDCAKFVDACGNPLGETLEITVGEVTVTAQVHVYGNCLTLTFDGCETAGLDLDLSKLIGVKLPVDDSSDFKVHVAVTTTEVKPEGDVACESKTTETCFDVHVGGVAGPAAIEFGDYSDIRGCCDPVVEGNTLTLSVFEDGVGSVHGQDCAGPLVVPVAFCARTQDSDGSEKITKVVLSLNGAPEGALFTDGSGEPITEGQAVAGGVASFDEDGNLVITFAGEGVDPVHLSDIGVKLPLHSDDDFQIKIVTTTTEYDDDGEGALVATHETDAFINVKVDAVADPVTVSVDAQSASGDEAFAPGEEGTVKVTATFADLDGSETHTVTLKVPAGFTVLDTAGGTLDGDTITWTLSDDQADFEVYVSVKANDGLTEDETVKWQAKAKAVEKNSNTDVSLGDAECTTRNNTAVDFDKDKVTLDPALPPEVAVLIQGDAVCIKEDGEGSFSVKIDAQGDDFVKQIKVDNLPDGWDVTIVGSDESDGGSFNPVTGIYTTGGNPQSVTLTVTLTPPADSDLDVATVMDGKDITFTATAEDPESGDTADSEPVAVDVNVDAVADDVTVNITVNDSADDDGNLFSPNETGTVRVEATFGDAADGSEEHTVTVQIPAGFTIGALDGLPAGVTADIVNGNVIFTLGSGVTSLDYTFEVTAPANTQDGTPFLFKADAKAKETPDDAECDDTDNVEEASDYAMIYGEAAGDPEVGLQVGGAGYVKEDTQTDVTITANTTTPGDTLTKVVITAPAGWVLNAAVGGDIASVEGDGSTTLTLTLVPGVTSFSQVIQATPPADTDVDATFTVSAEAVDGLDSATGSNNFPVVVDAILDHAVELGENGAVAGDESTDEQTFSLGLDSSIVTPFTGSGEGGPDGDGSETTTVTLTLNAPLPEGATLSSTGGTLTPTDDPKVFTITGDIEAIIDGLQVTVPGGFEGLISGTITTNSSEKNTPAGTVPASGQEPDTADNTSEDSVDFAVRIAGGEVKPSAAIGLPEGVSAIKEDSENNVVKFSASADNETDELTTIVIELPNVAEGDVDVAQIETDLDGKGSVEVSEAGGKTTITITFNDAADVQSFESSFTLDAPDEDSDVDLAGVKITANAKDISDPSATGSSEATTTIVVDAVLDEAGSATQGAAPTESESDAPQLIDLNLSLGFVPAGFALSGAGEVDDDGSEQITAVKITLSAGTLEFGPTAPADCLLNFSDGVYTLIVQTPADYAQAIASLQVHVPAGYEGTVTGTISVTTEEVSPNGGEPDTTDNKATITNNFSATVTGGSVNPTAAIGLPAGKAAIKEDSEDNVVEFNASSGHNTDELISIVIELPGVATGDIDIAQIITNLGANGTAEVTTPGGLTTITITFNDAADVKSFSSSFTLDAPVEDSDVDLTGIKITANAKDISDPSATDSTEATTTIVVDAILDHALELGADGATGGNESAVEQTFGLGIDSAWTSPFPGSNDGGLDEDNSESTTVTLTLDNPLPVGAVLSSTGGTVTQDLANDPSGKTYIIEGVDLEAAIDGLQVTVPGGFDGTISGTISTESSEANTPPDSTVPASGQEPDTSDNERQDSVRFEVTVTGGEVEPEASIALADGGDCIKEDSLGNVITFSASSGDETDELTTVVIELPGVAGGDVDVTQIASDLVGKGTVQVSEAGGTTTITITFNDAADVESFSSSFTLDAPVANSDVDITGITITANAKDKSDPAKTGSGGDNLDIHVDAVVDGSEVTQTVAAQGDEDTTIDLNLAIDLGGDSTSVLTSPDVDQPATQGGADKDGSESITEVVVTLSTGTLGWTLPDGMAAPTPGPDGTWTFNTAGASLDQVKALVDSLKVTPPAGFDGQINVTVTTTTAEKATVGGDNGTSGEECTNADNVDVDTYDFVVTVNPTVLPPDVDVQLDGNAACIKEDGSVEFNIVVSAQDGTDDVVNTVTFHQFKALAVKGWGVQISDGPANGSFDADFNYTADGVSQSVTFTVTLTPPADSDRDVLTDLGADLGVSATAKDGALVSGVTGPVVIDVNVDAVADDVTVTIDAVSASGDEAFAPGETGTVKVEASFGDHADGSETHTVTVTVPAGFTVTDAAGGTVDGNTITWTVTGGSLNVELQVQATDPLPGEQPVTWHAEAKAVEKANVDEECDPNDNTEVATASDEVTLDPALPPSVAVSLEGQPLCIKEDSSGQFTVTATAQGDDVISQIKVDNLPTGWGVSITGNDGGVMNYVTGIYTTNGNPAAVVLTVVLTPPADSDVDVATLMGNDITFTATAKDPQSGDTADSTPAVADVNVDAVADAVNVTIDAVSASGDEIFTPGETGTVTVTASFGDHADGSETHTVTVTVPEGFSVIDLDGGELVGNTITWTVTGGDFEAELQVEATGSQPTEQSANWTAEAKAVEQVTDGECNFADNQATHQASDEVTLDATTPVLVVGENVDDKAGQTTDHRVKNPDGSPDGTITGNATNDALIGDVGGAALVGKVVNIALVLDASTSMGTNITYNGATMTRAQALNLAVDKLLDDLGNVAGATIRVHMTVFGSDVIREGTFDLRVNGEKNQSGINDAKSFSVSSSGTQYTNYEAGFQSALDWFQSGSPHSGPGVVNQTIFMSDGAPTAAYTADGTSSVSTYDTDGDIAALNHVLGNYNPAGTNNDDHVNEFDLLNAIAPVQTIGLAISNNTHIGWLGQIDADGQTTNVTTGEGLEQVFGDIAQVNSLSSVGSDSIEGGAGGDLMVGDTVFTDLLADATGVVLPDGSGWEVIQNLMNNNPSFFNAWSGSTLQEKVISFLRDPAAQQTYQLFRESVDEEGKGRAGGHDTINGGDGNDSIYGQEGNDVINGGSGDDLIVGGTGNDTMTGGTGRDTFRWTEADHGQAQAGGFVFSTSGSGNVPTVGSFQDEDLVKWQNGTFSLFFDGTPGLGDEDIDAVHVLNPQTGTFIFSIADDNWDPPGGLNDADAEDLILWNGSSYSVFFNGSDHNLGSENIDAVHVVDLDAGTFVFSVSNNWDYPGTGSAGGEDLMLWNGSSHSKWWDGSDHGMSGNIDALHILDFDAKTFVFSTSGDWNGFADEDLILWNGSSFSLYFDGSANSVSNNTGGQDEDIDAVFLLPGAPTVTDTITDFDLGASGDVIDLDELLPDSVNGSTSAADLTEYLHFSYAGGNTTISVDHDGGATHQPTLNIVLQGVDLTNGGALNDQAIIQNLIDNNQLVV